jgi:hypothetical protein
MSERASTSFEARSCSGDAYAGDASRVWLCVDSPTRDSSVFAIPKSSTLRKSSRPASDVRNRLLGLRSRWIVPPRCASARASPAWITIAAAAATGSGPRSRRAASVSPSRYSITMYGAPGPSPTTSSTRTTCALWMRAAARASRISRRRASALGRRSGRSSLMARSSPSSRCRASTTHPIPPAPSSRSTTKRPPITAPGVAQV